MITIIGKGLTKVYNHNTIFQNLDIHIKAGEKWAVLGRNGAGKSTFLKCLIGFADLTGGKVDFLSAEGNVLPSSAHFKSVSACHPAPYFEPNMRLTEIAKLHFIFRDSLLPKGEDIFECFSFQAHKRKKIYQLSSGLLQRFKLMLAFATNSNILALDEPCTNLDADGIQWYNTLLEESLHGRTLLIASNRKEEWSICEHQLNIQEYV